MLWEIDLYPRPGLPDRDAAALADDLRRLGRFVPEPLASARGFLVQGERLDERAVRQLAEQLFADALVEESRWAPVGNPDLIAPPPSLAAHEEAHATACRNLQIVHVLLKPGVMDPVARSAQAAAADVGVPVEAVRTLRKYWLGGLAADEIAAWGAKALLNDAIEEIVIGPLRFDRIDVGRRYDFALRTVPIRDLDDPQLQALSRSGQLYLQLAEMQTIQRHFRELNRDPTDAELETLAQTWSEHCSHKTLAGRIAYRDERQSIEFDNMLKETIFAATQQLRARWGADDWCVSVFKDNAGVVRFDDQYHVAFKVETHNHPSALEPYGGANTGIGGVIRDTMGTGLGARPVCNTDVFCFAPPDLPNEQIPPGSMHPRRMLRGVVAGVRDYGNRMGIPTVNGAVYFDPRYVGNPLVYCGNVGVIPGDKAFKQAQPGDLIVAVGGRTGRDGIHGATFSSAELTHESESLSGGAVQIGNAVQEKMVLDVLLAARDRDLFNSVTDCGAGGFSSAVGEMGEEIGAEVWLDQAPLKYEGLSYAEIWISEAQERMVLSVPEAHWPTLRALCQSEDVEASAIGRFVPTKRLKLLYRDVVVADLSMEFLHHGRPPVIRQAVYAPPPSQPLQLPVRDDYGPDLLRVLGALNVASKEAIIRQYDHEVQGGSVVKPLVGVAHDGPSDAAVVRPRLDSRRGLAIACGMNPRYGDLDPYHMATSAIDEAVRNCVAVGADPRRIALLDNFCWGDCEKSETLGSLVRAALACRDAAIAWETPFISGKDSLNNEFSYFEADGKRRSIAIPPSLLISALGQIADVERCVTMDLKRPGNLLVLVGLTHDELGGSQAALVHELPGGQVPRVDLASAKRTFASLHRAIEARCVAACHDLSEGGLAVAFAEMAFAGGLGATLRLADVPHDFPACEPASGAAGDRITPLLMFSESNSRFLCEVPADKLSELAQILADTPHAVVGIVEATDKLQIVSPTGKPCVSLSLATAKSAWQAPLRDL